MDNETTVIKIRAGYYVLGDVAIVRVAGRAWITRSRFDPRDTYDWFDSKRDAVQALTANR